MNDKEGEPLTPGQFAPLSGDNSPWWKKHQSQLITFSALVMVLLVVIFILPAAVAPEKNTADSASAGPVIGGKVESPWSEAQLAKQRREAQGILSDMLKVQQELEDQKVEEWAAEAYAAAMAAALEGDNLYRQRQFAEAQNQYRDSLKQFQALSDQVDAQFEQRMSEGRAAIANSDAPAAIEAFSVATAIKPDDGDARLGLSQAEALTDVLTLLKQATLQEKTGNFDAAKDLIQEALVKDDTSSLAQARLKAIRSQILERDFTQAMSDGYAALGAQKFDSAKKAFRQAIKLKPGSADAKAALTQSGNQKTQRSIETLLTAAKSREAQEDWQGALDNYKKATELDGSVVAARIGQIRTGARLDLDKSLTQTLEKPERLTTDGVYRQAQGWLNDAEKLQNKGPRLQQQINQLQDIMAKVVVPVNVQLRSDNLTDVTVYKVGKLGTFSEQSLTLKPGTYVAVGKRDGYRDVRAEFTVNWDKATGAVDIRCEERVASL